MLESKFAVQKDYSADFWEFSPDASFHSACVCAERKGGEGEGDVHKISVSRANCVVCVCVCVCLCMFVRVPPASQFVGCVCVYECVCVWTCVCVRVYGCSEVSVCLCVCVSTCLCVRLSVCLCVCVSLCLCVCAFVCLWTDLSGFYWKINDRYARNWHELYTLDLKPQALKYLYQVDTSSRRAHRRAGPQVFLHYEKGRAGYELYTHTRTKEIYTNEKRST